MDIKLGNSLSRIIDLSPEKDVMYNLLKGRITNEARSAKEMKQETLDIPADIYVSLYR